MSVFFDTNILVYAFSNDSRTPKAQSIVAAGGIISVQVLNEFTNVLRKKLKQDWPIVESATAVLRNRFQRILPLSVSTNAAAVGIARDHGIAFYDALIVASALEAGCGTLFTEDMQHGRQFGDLAILNPFL